MAKATNQIFDVIKLVILLVVGVFVFLFIRDKYLKTKKEQQEDEEFKQRGFFASAGRFLFGDQAFEDTPNTTEKDAEQQAQRDKALEEIARLNELAQQQNIENERIRKEAERQAQKDIAKDPNQDIANRIDEIEKQIRNQREKEKQQGKDETFDRTKDDFRIFRFSEPIQTKSGIISDFAVKVIQPTTTQAELKKLQEEAKKQAASVGLLGKDKLGRDLTPIVALRPETIKRLETDERLRKAIENSQLRRLGLRQPTQSNKVVR